MKEKEQQNHQRHAPLATVCPTVSPVIINIIGAGFVVIVVGPWPIPRRAAGSSRILTFPLRESLGPLLRVFPVAVGLLFADVGGHSMLPLSFVSFTLHVACYNIIVWWVEHASVTSATTNMMVYVLDAD